jgi:hypothetical protein
VSNAEEVGTVSGRNETRSQKINTSEDLPVEDAASDSEVFHPEPPKPSLNPNWCGSPSGNA